MVGAGSKFQYTLELFYLKCSVFGYSNPQISSPPAETSKRRFIIIIIIIFLFIYFFFSG